MKPLILIFLLKWYRKCQSCWLYINDREEPSVIDPIDDSILSNDKSDLEISPNVFDTIVIHQKTTLSFSEISVTPTNDSLIV